MSRLRWLLMLAAVMLPGCASQPAAPALPKTVTMEVDRYVPIDDSLLQPCPIEEPRTRAVSEAVRVANARKLALQKCNADKAAIRATQPHPSNVMPQP